MKVTVIVLGIVILVLLGVLFFVPGVKSPTSEIGSEVSSSSRLTAVAISPDGNVKVDAPMAGSVVTSPISVVGTVTGGDWFFEASFPVEVIDADGTVLGSGEADAQPADAWTSTSTVAFVATIGFTQAHSATGTVVLSKDNPSGLPANDESFSIPVRFK